MLLCWASNVCPQTRGALIECPVLGSLVIAHTGYTLSYNLRTHCPDWVAWELTGEEACSSKVKRSDCFRGDPAVRHAHRVEPYDYKGSGFDRGHMCPSGDMKWSADAMSECFLMTNICPQTPVLNQQWWEHLERACRRWAAQEGSVYICCGPIYDNDRQPRYIGDGVKVRVPDGFFKVVLSLRKGHEKAIGFIYRNTDERQTMEAAATTVDEVERVTGLDFFSAVEDQMEAKVEGSFNLRKWN